MRNHLKGHSAIALLLCVGAFISGCGGSSEEPSPQASVPAPAPPAAAPPPAVAAGNVNLKPPVLTFSDTGLNVSDGVTSNGLWTVANDGFAWEYSLDLGTTWVLGSGSSFQVFGDGSKTIWVRSRDDAGNTSAIVMVACVLDTMPPASPSVSPQTVGMTRTLLINGLEMGARWEYSLDDQQTWLAGAGPGLGVLGNGQNKVSIRQVDLAGNVSMAQNIELESLTDNSWHEASGNALQPSLLNVSGLQTVLVHGSVVRNDADYLTWNIPSGFRLKSVRLVRYVSDDKVAFYAIQRAPVFDAGVDVTRMLVYGHMGPQDLGVNVLAPVPAESLVSGPMTLWFQQTGPLPTQYAIELTLQPL